ncbi:MAG: carboxymuconolactone decarboxylase family protein [bacterium]
MARLPLLDANTVDDPAIVAIFDQARAMGLGKFIHQLQALAHHPALLKAVFGLLRAYYEDSVVERKYLEMAILVVSNHNRCRYCVVHHTPSALTAGLSAEQVEAINAGNWAESAAFDEAERAVLAFADQASQRGGRVDESLYATLRTIFSEQQMVELAVRTAMCEFFNRFNEIFHLEIEPEAQALYRQAAQ